MNLSALKTAKSKRSLQYVLISKDEFSGFVRFFCATGADPFAASDALVEWCKRLGIPTNLVRDQGSHFADQALKEFHRILQDKHHFVTILSFWANGSVEIVATCSPILECKQKIGDTSLSHKELQQNLPKLMPR